MNFNPHYDLAGKHAYLSASQGAWLNYSDEKFEATYHTKLAAALGTRYHELAAEAIRLGVKFPNTRKTLNMYVNEAIGYRMTAEQVLFYSENAFGTADAISFRKGLLRIHDLKTGVTPASMRQLEIYAAFFCLEYGVKPGEIQMELRIYQNDEVLVHTPELDTIVHTMGRIVSFDNKITSMRAEALV